MSAERTFRSTFSNSEDENRDGTSCVQTARLEDTNTKPTTDEIINIGNKNLYYLQTSAKKQINNNSHLKSSVLARKNLQAIQRPATSQRNPIEGSTNKIHIDFQR